MQPFLLKRLPETLLVLSLLPSQALADGNWDARFGVPGADPGGVAAVAVFDNKVIVGGNFTSIGGIAVTNLAQWDGTNWAPVSGGVQGFVNTLVASADGLFVGGLFSQVGELQVNNVAKWDGRNWSQLGEGVNSLVIAMACDGFNLYVGGHFTTAGRNAVGKVARWDGTNWSALGLGIVPVGGEGAVDSLAVARDGLYVGGRFRIAGSIAATNIARWDGFEWHALGNGLRRGDGWPSANGSVNALGAANGIVYAGGVFNLAGSFPATNIAAWDGTRWSHLGGAVNGLGWVSALTFSGRMLYAGGGFTNIGGVSAYRVASWDGQRWSPVGGGISERGRLGEGVSGLASTGSELAAVGVFTSAGGQRSTNVALWHIPHALAVERSETQVRLSWPETGSNFVLESSSALGLGEASWQPVPQAPVLEKPIFQVGEWVVTDALGSSHQFYRLRRR